MICCPSGLAPNRHQCRRNRTHSSPHTVRVPCGRMQRLVLRWVTARLRVRRLRSPATRAQRHVHDACADGGDVVQVTTTPGEDGAFDYSPDGSRIVLFRIDPTRPPFGQENIALFVVNVDGTDLHRVTPWGLGAFSASWSPDGRWILFNSNGRIWIVHPDGSGLRKIQIETDGRKYFAAQDPVWSPDGTQIALSLFVVGDGGHLDIYTMNSDGSDLVQVTHSPTGDEFPDWGTHALAK